MSNGAGGGDQIWKVVRVVAVAFVILVLLCLFFPHLRELFPEWLVPRERP